MKIKCALENTDNQTVANFDIRQHKSFIKSLLKNGGASVSDITKLLVKASGVKQNNRLNLTIEIESPGGFVGKFANLSHFDMSSSEHFDLMDDLTIRVPMHQVKNIKVEILLTPVGKIYMASTYNVSLNNELVISSVFNLQAGFTLIDSINFEHFVLEDEYDDSWLELAFEEGTTLHTNLLNKAKSAGLESKHDDEYGPFEEQFEDNGYQSKLDMYLCKGNIAIHNNVAAIPNYQESIATHPTYLAPLMVKSQNQMIVDTALSDIMTLPMALVANHLEEC